MAASVGVSLLSSVASADFIYGNAWDGTGNAFASQNDTAPGGFGNYATVYDSFTTTASLTQITDLTWVGEYFNGPDGAISNFELGFWYDDGTGQPGAFAGGINTGNNANETFLGNVAGFDCFSYEASINVLAGPGTYWLSIVADQDFPPQWGWSSGVGGGGQAYQDFFGGRNGLGVNMAFTMNGTTTPEPASMAAVGIGALALIRRRKNAKKA